MSPVTAPTREPATPEDVPRTSEESGPLALAGVFARVERGEWPPPDGRLRVVAQPSPRSAAVVAFTAHSVVAADVDADWVRSRLDPDDLAAPLRAPFLAALADRLARRVGAVDMVALASPLPGPPPVALSEWTDSEHPRVRRAHRYRDEVRVWGTEGGMVLVGRGLAGRWEVAYEVDPTHRGRGLGRLLASAARHLVPPDAHGVWAQVSPGNAASVRSILAAGYRPVGSEALLVATPG
ncbi:GNAT family N-acetyltransferase [Actinopolymorpha pittospori]